MRYVMPVLVAVAVLPAALPALAQDAVTEHVPLNGVVQLEKTTIPMHGPCPESTTLRIE